MPLVIMPSDDFMYGCSEQNPLKKSEYDKEEYESDKGDNCNDSL